MPVILWMQAKRAEMRQRRVAADTEAALMAEAYSISSEVQRDLDYHERLGWGGVADTNQVMTPETSAQLQVNAYKFFYTNPWAHAIISQLTNFVIGRGTRLRIGKGAAGDEALQKKWDDWARLRDWKSRVRELVLRGFRDGETFTRRFTDGDGPYHRFVRPALIAHATGDVKYGIETDPKDVETPLAYHVLDENDHSKEISDSPIPAEQMWHVRLNVDSECKRGVSVLKPVIAILPQIPKILSARLALHQLRTNVAKTKTVKGGPTETARVQAADRTERDVGDSSRVKMSKPGTVEYLTEGVQVEYKSPHFDAGDAGVDLRFFLLAIVAGTDLAEYMVTGDASNANYASTMVAESPAVRAIQAWQDFWDTPLENEARRVLEAIGGAKDVELDNQWAPIIYRNFPEEAKAYGLLKGSSLLSDETIRGELGFDHDEEIKRLARERDEALGDEEKELEGGPLESEEE